MGGIALRPLCSSRSGHDDFHQRRTPHGLTNAPGKFRQSACTHPRPHGQLPRGGIICNRFVNGSEFDAPLLEADNRLSLVENISRKSGQISSMSTKPPGLESRSMDLTFVHEWNDGKARRFQDYLVREEPMEIRVGMHSLSVTMRTPGNDLELAAGFLFSEGLIHQREEIEVIEHAESDKPSEAGNVVRIELSKDVRLDLESTQRNFFAASSCGICGKASLDSVRLRGMRPPERSLRLEPEVLCGMPDLLRTSQVVFSRTGGLHAAGLFDNQGQLIVQREDVGRHNAVDKVIGWALLNGSIPLSKYVLLVSGRGGFEIIQKAVAAGVPIVASVSAPSGLAVRLAREMGLTLVGFLRGKRFIVYSGEHRLSLSDSDQVD
jgi:FdhD protein